MAEYIEREAILFCIEHDGRDGEYDLGYWPHNEEFQEIIKKIPAADVKPVQHGRWITKEYMYGDSDVGLEDMWVDRLAEASDYYAYCSNCGKDAEYTSEGEIVLSGYCPNCGADMRGEPDG